MFRYNLGLSYIDSFGQVNIDRRVRDVTTGLRNHLQLIRDLQELATQDPHASGALILIEVLDHEVVRRLFSARGPDATDGLLRSITRKLMNLTDLNTLAYYVGVARFAFVKRGPSEDIEHFAKDVSKIISESMLINEIELNFQGSISILNLQAAVSFPKDALRKATVALIDAQLCPEPQFYSKERDSMLSRKFDLLQALPNAIIKNELYLVFQPRLCLESGIFNAEALLRWRHSLWGQVSPADFIPLASGTRIMTRLTEWVIAAAVDAYLQLVRQGFSLQLSVNVSAIDLDDELFAHSTILYLDQRNVPPKHFQIECTEYAALNTSMAAENIKQLRAAGISVALDDFGNGHSNFSAMNGLAVDSIKLDKSLIEKIEKDSYSNKVFVSLVLFMKSLGYRITAEGVEDPEVIKKLKVLKIDEIQGFAISKPLALDALCAFLSSVPDKNSLSMSHS